MERSIFPLNIGDGVLHIITNETLFIYDHPLGTARNSNIQLTICVGILKRTNIVVMWGQWLL